MLISLERAIKAVQAVLTGEKTAAFGFVATLDGLLSVSPVDRTHFYSDTSCIFVAFL